MLARHHRGCLCETPGEAGSVGHCRRPSVQPQEWWLRLQGPRLWLPWGGQSAICGAEELLHEWGGEGVNVMDAQ